MQKLKPYHLEDLYATLGKTPCGQYLEGKKQVLSEKQQQRLLSGTTIHEVHRLLRTAFQYAVEWGILVKSPVPVDSPKKSIQERAIWDADEMWAALASMEDPILHLAVHLTLVGALREGEVAGLTPENLDFEGADGTGTFRINKCMQRVQKISLAKTGKDCILQEFEDKREGSTTTLVLKKTKTASSNRTIFMTAVLKEELKHWLKRLEMDEAVEPERYRNSGMLLRLPNGLAVEPILIRKKFIKVGVAFHIRVLCDPFGFQHGGYRFFVGLFHFDFERNAALTERLADKNIECRRKIHAEFGEQGVCLCFQVGIHANADVGRCHKNHLLCFYYNALHEDCNMMHEKIDELPEKKQN